MTYDLEVTIEEEVTLKWFFTSVCNLPLYWHATLLKPKRKTKASLWRHDLGRGREFLGTSWLVVAFTNKRQSKDEKGWINDERNMTRKESRIKKHDSADWQRQRSSRHLMGSCGVTKKQKLSLLEKLIKICLWVVEVSQKS